MEGSPATTTKRTTPAAAAVGTAAAATTFSLSFSNIRQQDRGKQQDCCNAQCGFHHDWVLHRRPIERTRAHTISSTWWNHGKAGIAPAFRGIR
jgi:hypothetical protein